MFGIVIVSHVIISIHAPREGCDGATDGCAVYYCISIHAPREGCDDASLMSIRRMTYFNPRTP